MFLRMRTAEFTKDYSQQIKQLKSVLQGAEAVIVGAGAGLSVSAGFQYAGERFDRYFSDFKDKYGFCDMYSGGFYPYATLEEYWAYWSRHIYINRYMDAPKPVYDDLLGTVKNKDYFIITTNVDHCFQKAGFAKERLFYTQGDYGLFQCAKPCCRKTYENKGVVRTMLAEQKDMKIPAVLIPKCPRCGSPMVMNLRIDERFVEDEGWEQAAQRYALYLRSHENRKTLFLELGVGANTPGIIKYPFWQMTAKNPNAVYACINDGEAGCPQEIAGQSICINGDIGTVLQQVK